MQIDREAVRKLAKITIQVEQEDIPVRGNASASGDSDYDREIEDAILARLRDGDEWAWAYVTVTANMTGLTASAHLGSCTYDSKEAFIAANDYYPDLVNECLDAIVKVADESR